MNECISLRALEPEDLELMYAWENNPDIWQISCTIAPFSKFILKQYLETAHQDIYQTRQLRMIVALMQDGASLNDRTAIGSVELFDFDPFHNRAGVGLMITNQSDRKKGYGTTALQKLIAYCFDTLLLHQIYCHISVSNSNSISLFEKAGFIKTGVKPQWNRTKDGYEDVLFYQMINPANCHTPEYDQ